MHILVTDATGTVGRLVARQLIAAGHTVTGIAEHPHACLDAGVSFVCAPLSDPILQQLADEADAVIHLAPVDPEAPGSADIDGVARVTHAASRAGARLLFVSQAAGRSDLYQPAEDLVSTSWGPSLVIRIAPPVGRQLDWMVCRTVATLLRAKVSEQPMRVLHLDDLVRFLVFSVDTDRTGVVDLATPDTINVITAWRLLRSVSPRSRLQRNPQLATADPELDIAADTRGLDVRVRLEGGRGGHRHRAWTCRPQSRRRGRTSHGRQLPLPVEVLPRSAPSGELGQRGTRGHGR